ncbi:MAG: type II toxin-antitoxin system prevent-host-death family antitoxin [Clostridia bacterium]|nr:type II toxin-antitoxin system prevent-host-death family antitoxin [Clostridia bacterium]
MPNIKPVSDLRNYNDVLRDIAVGEPVFLTKNGRGKYAIVDMEEYEMMQAKLKLLHELSRGEASLRDEDSVSLEEAAARLGVSL